MPCIWPLVRFLSDLWGMNIISLAFAGSAARPLFSSQHRVCSNPWTMDSAAAVVVLDIVKMAPSSM